MDKDRKPGEADRAAKAPTGREVRVNGRALALVAAAAVLAVPALLGVKALQDRAGRSALLREARKQLDQAKRPDLALAYLNRYLELAPDDLDAVDQRARLLGELAREPGALAGAIRAHTALLGRAPDGPASGPARVRLAELYLRSMQFHAAELAIAEHLRRGADDAESHRILARALEGEGRLGDAGALARAVAEYEAAEARRPGDVAAAERLAWIYRDKYGDEARALRVLDALLRHNPRSTAARLARSRFFADGGDVEAASAEVDAALRDAPGDAEARLVAAETAARRGDPGAARLHLAAIRPPRPDDIRVRIVQGLIELGDRRADDAIRQWRAGLVLAGGADAQLTWRLAHVLIQLGRVREAEPLLSQYRRLTGGEEPGPSYRYLAGLAALKSGRTAQAIAELEAVRYKLDRGLEGQLYLTLGQAYEASNEPGQAADAYARASAAPGSGATPWLALARLQSAERPGEEVATLDRAVASVGPEPRLLAELARAHWRRQVALPPGRRDWSGLEQVLEQGRRHAPDSAELALVRADHAAALGRPEDGLRILEAAAKQDPASATLWMAQVEGLARLGRVDEARARLDRAAESAGDQAPFRIARARFALARGEARAARAALAEGVDRVPAEQRPDLRKALGEFHQTQGDRAAATKAFREWAALRPDSTDPHVALLNLAIESGDDPAVDAEVEALKGIGGPRSTFWKIARAEALLRDRPGGSTPPAALEEAAGLAEDVKASSPRQPAGHLLEGRLMERRGRPDDAVRAYERALERKAGLLAIRPMAALLARLGRFGELDALRSRLGGFPAEIERLVGAEALRRAAPAEAEELARRLVEGDPSGLDARAWQARVLGMMGKTDEAERSLRQLAEARPEAPAPWVQLLMFQVSRGAYDRASATVEQIKARVKADRPELLWALCYRAAGLRDRADAAFDEALRLRPDDLATLQAAIDHYETTGRPGRAEPLLRAALAGRPGLDWARRRLAMNLAGRVGDRAAFDEALGLVGASTGAADTPDDRLARAAVLSLGPAPRRREAIPVLESLAAEMPGNAKVQESLARAFLAVDEPARARIHAARAASGDDAPAGAIRLAVALDLAAGDPAEASRRIERLEATAPADLATVELRARALRALGKPAEAVAAVEAAYSAREGLPDAAEAGRGLVRLLIGLGDPGAAERLARRVAGLGPAGQVVLAELLGAAGRADEAESLYEAAGRDRLARPDAARSALGLASLTRDGRWIALADRLLERPPSAGPDGDDLDYARASLRHLQGRFEESVRLYDALARRSSSNMTYLNNCAWILSEDLGRPAEGLQRIDALVARGGAQPHTLDTRGVILLRLGRVDEAIRDLESAAGLIPSGAICFHLARAYLAAGRGAEAAQAAARAAAAGLKAEQLQPSERVDFDRVMATAATAR